MAHATRAIHPTHASQEAHPRANSSGDWKLGALAVATVAALLYGGVYAPTQNQLQQLERQCDKLAKTVSELTAAGVSADRTATLLAVLQEQGKQIGSAEKSLLQLSSLREQIVEEAGRALKTTDALKDLDRVHQAMAACGRTLSDAAGALHQMADLSMALDASRELAREARTSLAVLDALHEDLSVGLKGVEEAAPVLDQVRDFCGRVSDSRGLVEAAAEVQAAASKLEQRLVDGRANLPVAQRVCEGFSTICDDLAGHDEEIAAAETRLARLLKLKNGLLNHTLDLDEADGALERLFDMRDRLAHASSTISDLQHLVVDIVLLQPAVDRAVIALRPMVEITRLARQSASQSQASPKNAATGVPTRVSTKASLDVAEAIRSAAE